MKGLKSVALLSLLALLIVVSRVTGEANAAVFAFHNAPSDSADTRRDLLALMLAYPDTVTGVEASEGGSVYIVTSRGERLLYDDGRGKSFDELLWDADIQDAMSLPYPPHMICALPEGNSDPGRIRCYPLLRALYGGSRAEVEKSLSSVSPCGRFNGRNGAAAALEAAFGDIAGLLKEAPAASRFVYPLNGTYNYRVIAGTDTLSPHAFGIAIDLASGSGDYWRWSTREQGQKRLDSYPPALVAVMEARGFIWGGKWAHFDCLHFEYRPELLIKARADAARRGSVWHSGFPDDEKTRVKVRMIDAALA